MAIHSGMAKYQTLLAKHAALVLYHSPAGAVPYTVVAEVVRCPGTADGQSGQDVQAACAARRWLARNAATVSRVRSDILCVASACTSLVSCLPALEHVEFCLDFVKTNDLGCLVEVLAWCPCLGAVDLFVVGREGDDRAQLFRNAPAFAKLHSLTSLALCFSDAEANHALADVVDALASLTGLEELKVSLSQPAVVPAALAQLKGLKALQLTNMRPCVLEAGCLNLPMLESLEFDHWDNKDAGGLMGVTDLHNLMHIEFTDGQGPPFVTQLLQLPQLVRVVIDNDNLRPHPGSASLGLARLPADMGLQSMALTHLSFSGKRSPSFRSLSRSWLLLRI